MREKRLSRGGRLAGVQRIATIVSSSTESMPADTQVDIVPADEYCHFPYRYCGTTRCSWRWGCWSWRVVWQRACYSFRAPKGAISPCSISVWRPACMVPDCWSRQTRSLGCCRAWRQHSRSPTGSLPGLIPVPLGLFFAEIVAPQMEETGAGGGGRRVSRRTRLHCRASAGPRRRNLTEQSTASWCC